ncbi:MAG TPA: DnaJ domain-containing protein [Candidatus Limnocylindrales bacterium]|nr:DnaJ domain-containing protein [Candidatus Limnocylindrales bacterium]
MPQSLLPYRPERDIYRLLSVEPTADDREIEVAWRRLARTFHPDRNRSARAHEEMQVVNAVRELLSDPAARTTYDLQRRRYLRAIGASPVPAARAVAVGPAEPASSAWTDRVSAFFAKALSAFGDLRPTRCPGCGEPAERSHRYCAQCGTPIRPLGELSGR